MKRNEEIQWAIECAERAEFRREAAVRLRQRPMAVRRPTRKDWQGLAVACALWTLALAVGVAVVYGIATVPPGWWIEGGLK